MGKFEDLRVWQKAREMNRLVLAVVGHPRLRGRRYLVDQLERASSACANNISEGYARNSFPQLRSAFNIAIGSAAEVQNLMYQLSDSGLCSQQEFAAIYDLSATIQKMAKSFLLADQLRRGNLKTVPSPKR